jgi:hypothetical protein
MAPAARVRLLLLREHMLYYLREVRLIAWECSERCDERDEASSMYSRLIVVAPAANGFSCAFARDSLYAYCP